ncbi:hypothetical protein [Shewanella woodyi]|uniref:Uncharacterized protein n=1 Tax=Shewanella woodyi (strain ATCC 51908 / MS32) TaxID=392500 RepID=B1KKS9_SHEWM|nr:hypothetical protein [Shewanella woodyi]ACA87296.1 hypothetical protein Swoo_3025 [Shewanella woodyi ATCC 51908]
MLLSIFIVTVLPLSGYVMGKLAFQAGLGVKRWAVVGLLLGPAGYPLLNTYKRFAMKKASVKGSSQFQC